MPSKLVMAAVFALTCFCSLARVTAQTLPEGPAPAPVPANHFPTRAHAVVWRNWQLVPAERIGRVIGASRNEVVRMGRSMGLSGPPPATADQQRRSYITVIRRNWHLLPYEQLLQLLDWDAGRMAYTLREDDFLYVKLGSLKPKCRPVKWTPPTPEALAREKEIAEVVHREFPQGAGVPAEPLFDFVRQLARRPETNGKQPKRTPDAGVERFQASGLRAVGKLTRPERTHTAGVEGFQGSGAISVGKLTRPERTHTAGVEALRMVYSYAALYGDPLLDTATDPYPDGYLTRLADCGVNAVWMQAVLYKLTPFPWDPKLSEGWQARQSALRKLVDRAGRRGIRIFLYLNEPRAMPNSFFQNHQELRGVTEGDYSALCSTAPAVKEYLRSSLAHIVRAVPRIGGFFTISASENLTNCWSHYRGAQCPRCGKLPPEEVIRDLHASIRRGIEQGSDPAMGTPALTAWDWGWQDEWIEGIIRGLPAGVAVQSVSEWSVPIERGGVRTEVGEYSLSAIGPGPRARRTWAAAKAAGLPAVAKIQAANTWELSAVPYIPAVAQTARHALRLRAAGVDGIMLGWTLGGYPSPNLQAVARAAELPPPTGEPTDEEVREALLRTARPRFGRSADKVADAWIAMSRAFQEFPFNAGTVYSAPLQMGPANPLYARRTGYAASMVGIPYDDLSAWRSVYPAEVFAAQLRKVAAGFAEGAEALQGAANLAAGKVRNELQSESRIAEAAGIHFRSVANQADFVRLRDSLQGTQHDAAPPELIPLIRDELALARRLHALQSADSRLGFEATNHYYYVPLDLVEKALICVRLLKPEAWR